MLIHYQGMYVLHKDCSFNVLLHNQARWWKQRTLQFSEALWLVSILLHGNKFNNSPSHSAIYLWGNDTGLKCWEVYRQPWYLQKQYLSEAYGAWYQYFEKELRNCILGESIEMWLSYQGVRFFGPFLSNFKGSETMEEKGKCGCSKKLTNLCECIMVVTYYAIFDQDGCMFLLQWHCSWIELSLIKLIIVMIQWRYFQITTFHMRYIQLSLFFR